jgi:hypothetical protein
MKANIESSEDSRNHSNISAAIAMHLFDRVTVTTDRAWLHHIWGISRLTELRGPQRYQEYPEHSYAPRNYISELFTD